MTTTGSTTSSFREIADGWLGEGFKRCHRKVYRKVNPISHPTAGESFPASQLPFACPKNNSPLSKSQEWNSFWTSTTDPVTPKYSTSPQPVRSLSACKLYICVSCYLQHVKLLVNKKKLNYPHDSLLGQLKRTERWLKKKRNIAQF